MGIGQAVEFDWSDHGTIILDPPPGWKLERTQIEGVGCSFQARPDSDVVALLQVTVKEIKDGQAIDATALRELLRDSVKKFIIGSVEREFRPVALSPRQGQGWYVQLSDASLADKPAVPDDYKVMRNAVILINQRILIVATMLLDDPKTREAADMLAMVSSLRFDQGTASGLTKK